MQVARQPGKAFIQVGEHPQVLYACQGIILRNVKISRRLPSQITFRIAVRRPI